jgi:hypothetical protein
MCQSMAEMHGCNYIKFILLLINLNIGTVTLIDAHFCCHVLYS